MHAHVLRYLDEVVRRGSIRKAAEALNVAASAVNRQILKLEGELGLALFERRAAGVRPTPAGEILARHARDTLYAFDRARVAIDDLRGLRAGHVRIVALDSLMVDFLPEALGAFRAAHPGVTFAVMALGPSDLRDELDAGRADIGISFRLAKGDRGRALIEIPTPMHAMVARGHPLARKKATTLAECARYPIALGHDTLPLTPLLEAELALAGADPAPFVRSNSMELMRQMVRGGGCVAFFTRLGFTRDIAERSVVAIPLAEPRLAQIRLAVIVGAQGRATLAATAVAEHLARELVRFTASPEPGRER